MFLEHQKKQESIETSLEAIKFEQSLEKASLDRALHSLGFHNRESFYHYLESLKESDPEAKLEIEQQIEDLESTIQSLLSQVESHQEVEKRRKLLQEIAQDTPRLKFY